MAEGPTSSDRLSSNRVVNAMTIDVLRNFDGSVRYSQGNTEILAFVNGPFEVSSKLI